MKLYRTNETKEGFYTYGDMIAVDWNHNDSPIGYNLTQNVMFSPVIERHLDEISESYLSDRERKVALSFNLYQYV